MSEQCYLNPERTRKYFPEHEYADSSDDPGRFICRFCHTPRGDMTCYCPVYVAGEMSKHTRKEHEDKSCSGYGGPCGGCVECAGQQLLYSADEYYTKWLQTEENRLRTEERESVAQKTSQ